jgi:hypothetical protein
MNDCLLSFVTGFFWDDKGSICGVNGSSGFFLYVVWATMGLGAERKSALVLFF